MSVGFPACLLLDDFGSVVRDAFGETPYHVGSSATKKQGWRDVDVRLLLDDEEYERQGFGHPERPHDSPKWRALCLAFSAMGKSMTGLPIDFQIQQRTWANKHYGRGQKCYRSALGLAPWRFR